MTHPSEGIFDGMQADVSQSGLKLPTRTEAEAEARASTLVKWLRFAAHHDWAGLSREVLIAKCIEAADRIESLETALAQYTPAHDLITREGE